MTKQLSDKKSIKITQHQPNYLTPNYQQDTFISVSPQDQIQPNTFEFAIRHLIDNKLDLSIFDKRYSNSGTGRKAYAPSVLLKIILLSYSMGTTSSRTMEKLCRVHVTFMALSGFSYPDHSTFAAFVSKLEHEIVDLFQQVLFICNEEGLIGKQLFAIDGCKLPSNASKESSGTQDELERKSEKLRQAVQRMVVKHQSNDNSDYDEELKAHEEKQIETLNAQSDRIDAFLKNNEPRIGSRGKEVQSNITDNDSAKMQTSHGAIQGYTGIAAGDSLYQVITQAGAAGQGSEQSLLKPCIEELRENLLAITPELKRDDVLKQSILLTDSGFHSEENLQWLSQEKITSYIADNQFRKRDPRFNDADRFKKTKHGKRPSTNINKFGLQDFTVDLKKMTCTCPAGKALWLITEKPLRVYNALCYRFRGYEKDCRDCELRSHCLKNKNQKSPRQLSIPIKKIPLKENHTQRMIEKIDTPEGRKIYSQRLGIIEPIFGNIRTTKGLDRFTLRGQSKVDAQWKLFCMVHNIEKIKNYGQMC